MAATTYSGATTQRHAPAGAGPMPGVKMESIDNASPEIKALINQLNRFAHARSLEEHDRALQGFDEDLTIDTPFIMVQGRDRLRALSSFYKFFLGNFDVEPRLVKISVPEGAAVKGGKLDVDGIVHWMPHRPWYLPLTLLLPRDIPIYADVSLGVKAHNDKVYFLSGKNHNLPHVPRIVRMLAGYVAGFAASVAEPAYNALKDWYYTGMEGVSRGTEMIRDTTASAADTVKDTASSITHTVGSTMDKAADTLGVKDTVNAVTGTVSSTVSKAAETVGLKDKGI